MSHHHGGLMEEMTWPEVSAAAERNLPVVLAIGATEQHGRHLPLGTDCLIPVGVALETAKRYPVVIAPPVRFGARSRPLSGGGESFPGTLSLRATTLIETIRQVLEGLARSGFRRLCVQNWHFENAGLLWEACDLAAAAHPKVTTLLIEDPMPQFSQTELSELFPGGFPGWDVEHASVAETSLMYVLHPELVRREKVVDDHAERHPTWDLIPPPKEFIPESGVLSRPSDATEEIGRRLLSAIAARLEDALRTEFGPPVEAGGSNG